MESSNKDRTPEETYLADRDSKAGNVSRRFPNMLSRFRKKSSEENVVAETPLDEMTSKQTLEVGNIEKGEFEEGTGDQAGFKGKHDPFNSTEDAKVYKTMTWLSVNPRSKTIMHASDTHPGTQDLVTPLP